MFKTYRTSSQKKERTYRTCNPTVEFLKYEFNNKLLDYLTLLRVIPSIT